MKVGKIQEESGLGVAAFCKKYGISAGSFYRHRDSNLKDVPGNTRKKLDKFVGAAVTEVKVAKRSWTSDAVALTPGQKAAAKRKANREATLAVVETNKALTEKLNLKTIEDCCKAEESKERLIQSLEEGKIRAIRQFNDNIELAKRQLYEIAEARVGITQTELDKLSAGLKGTKYKLVLTSGEEEEETAGFLRPNRSAESESHVN